MDFPIEYHDRMIAEQMVMMEAFQFIWQILICFTILMTVVSLIVNLIEGRGRLARGQGNQEIH